MTDHYDNDAAIDAWHDGYFNERKPTAPVLLAAWTEGRAEAIRTKGVIVVPVERPEGYYHAPIGTFD